MKLYPILLGISLFPIAAWGQKMVAPGSPDINTKYIKPEKSLYTVYYVKDNNWDKQGSLIYDVTSTGNQLTLKNSFTQR